MPSHQLAHSLANAEPTSNHVHRVSVDNDLYSLVVCSDIPVDIYYKLTKNFFVVEHSATMRVESVDAGFLDCRNTEIRIPKDAGDNCPNIILALVNNASYLPANAEDHDPRFELVTLSDLDSSTLQLRLAARLSCDVKQQQTNEQKDVAKENAYEIMRAFVQHSTDWMVFKDLEHRFVVVSDRFLKSHRKSEKEIIGKNDLEIGTPTELVLGNEEKNWKGYWCLDNEVIESGKPSYTEHLVIHENALEQIREHVAKVPVKDANGNIIGLLVCITQARTSKINGIEVPSLASRHNIEGSPIIRSLDDERSKAVAMNMQTQSAFKRKNNFIATASHDLRQPLHAIGLFIEALQNQIVDTEQRSTLAKMKQSSSDLNELLNSILDISKLDADAVEAKHTHFCIAPLLKSIEDEFGTVASGKSLTLHVACTNAIVRTDSLLLARILKNLVSNAVKHTTAGTVNVITELESDSLLIHIKDSGPGIPEEQYLAIFDEYHQLDKQDAQPNFGMGLGLSIVKRLTDLLNMEITLDSKLDRGTRFTLRVPLGDALNSDVSNSNDKTLEPIEAYKLMIVEDNPLVLDAMQQMLTGMNCDVYPASDIPEALEIISELSELPDLLIVDYQLADGITGDTAIEKICEAAGETLPAIIVTGNTNNALFRKASESAYRVLNKPVNSDVLLSSIASAVKEHGEVAV